MCEGDSGSTCEMNSCDENTASKVNFTYFLAIAFCVFVAIFIFCIYVCFKCNHGRDERYNRRPTAAELNDGAVDMVSFNMIPHMGI